MFSVALGVAAADRNLFAIVLNKSCIALPGAQECDATTAGYLALAGPINVFEK
jgi:hypothetical protein